jgi:polysaccharide deacetylase family protein (PEP-CTERM system associated)
MSTGQIVNAMSIDLEDWFCVYNLSHAIPKANWDSCELRVEASTRKILALLDKHDTRATFFVLGWVAERLPDLVKEIEDGGHEIGSHGYGHSLLTHMTPEEFDEDIERSLAALDRCGVGANVLGYRAPSFTIVESTKPWAFETLGRHGFKYDSSIFPVGFHPDYGIGDAPLEPYRATDALQEFPMSCIDVFGKRLPVGGGGYFRLLPYKYTQLAMQRCNAAGRPAVFYLHPWELDPEQPKIKLPASKSFRHYHNLDKTEKRLDALLGDFRFGTLKEVLGL